MFLFYPSHEHGRFLALAAQSPGIIMEENFANNAELMRFLGHAAESENEKKRDKRREEKKKERQEKEKRKKRGKEDKQKSKKEPGSHHCSWLVSQFGLLRNPYNRGTGLVPPGFFFHASMPSKNPKKEAGSSSNHLPFRSELLNFGVVSWLKHRIFQCTE